MNFARGMASALLMVAVGGASSGCLKKLLLNGQIKGTLDGSGAVNTLHDYEIARRVAYAGLGQLEGMHKLAPDNTTALFMLTRGWAGATFGFTEDDYEQALEAGDDVMAQYHLMRTRAGFERARFYGIELLGHEADGFEEAKKSYDSIRAWLTENFTDPAQAETLMWVGYAWIGYVSASSDIPEIVGELYVGAEMMKRSVELDETVQYATGRTVLGAYHARTAMAELDESKQNFDRAMQINEGKFLSTPLNFATRYYCMKGDKENYAKVLNQVLEAGDPLPEARLPNTIAKRRARRYLGNPMWQENCGFTLDDQG
jgi:hypothetical protein